MKLPLVVVSVLAEEQVSVSITLQIRFKDV